jgi:hypothetical protein
LPGMRPSARSVIACGAASSALTNVWKQAESGKPFDVGSLLTDIAIGSVSGLLGPAGKVVGKILPAGGGKVVQTIKNTLQGGNKPVAAPKPAVPATGAVKAPVKATSSTKGGAGPVNQGKAGVDKFLSDFEKVGGTVLQREVSVRAGNTVTRIDLFVKMPNGSKAFIEVKTGAMAGLTKNQKVAFPVIRGGGGVPFGDRAAKAMLEVGEEMGPMPVWVVHMPWPL